jgi:hypothetical protein
MRTKCTEQNTQRHEIAPTKSIDLFFMILIIATKLTIIGNLGLKRKIPLELQQDFRFLSGLRYPIFFNPAYELPIRSEVSARTMLFWVA